MAARRRPVNKNDAKKPFVTKDSDNHTSETHITGVYTPMHFHMPWPQVLQHNVYT